jgi:ATP-binding protein involved in chromosome partitioning
MTDVDETALYNALREVEDALTGGNIVDSGLITSIQITNGQVIAMMEVDAQAGGDYEPLRHSAERALNEVPGVDKATVVMTAERKGGQDTLQDHQPQQTGAAPKDPHGMGRNPPLNDLPVKQIIAVASGKGGVGKSTVAANLAAALAGQGKRVGILDADIYGPSLPTLFGLAGHKPDQEENKLIPLQAHGCKLMSMGALVDPETAMVWRGPMIQTAIYQMLRDVDWGRDGELDVLVVDMPPGTGDAQLTLAQKVPVTGAVIVSTPQDLALIDARKAVEMFTKVDVPTLGIIENMSRFVCPHCGEASQIFGHGGARHQAENLDLPFLGEIPLTMAIREQSDSGALVQEGAVFDAIAGTISAQLEAIATAQAG